MKQLLQTISQRTGVSLALKEAIQNNFTYQEIPKSHVLLKEFQYCQQLYFLESGTIRTYYFDKEKEITSWFYVEGQFFTSWYSYYSQQASFEFIESSSDCVIYRISYLQYQQLLKAFPAFEHFGRLLAEEQLAFLDQYSKGYLFLSAKERYQLLTSYFPDIELRVKLGYIASFLGISQETLSRIRSGK